MKFGSSFTDIFNYVPVIKFEPSRPCNSFATLRRVISWRIYYYIFKTIVHIILSGYIQIWHLHRTLSRGYFFQDTVYLLYQIFNLLCCQLYME